MPASEAIAFREFCRRRELSPRIQRAFEADLRNQGVTFNYRPEAEWAQALAQFNAADRRRRVHG